MTIAAADLRTAVRKQGRATRKPGTAVRKRDRAARNPVTAVLRKRDWPGIETESTMPTGTAVRVD